MSSSENKRTMMREFLAELVGTFILVLMGDGAMAAYTLKSRDANRMDAFALSFTWGIGAMLAVMAVSGTSGGHINPAVTIANAVLGNMSWRKVPHYVVAQLSGAFAAAILVHVTYYDALQAFDGGMRITSSHQDATGQIFATYPSTFLSLSGAIIDQVIGTGILMFAAIAITDRERQNIPPHVQPIYIGLAITGITMAFGVNCMAGLNPARDLAPRFYCLIAGYGVSPFTLPLSGSYWWAVGVVAPIVGAVVGGLLYRACLDHRNLRSYSFYNVRKVETSHRHPSQITGSNPQHKITQHHGDNL